MLAQKQPYIERVRNSSLAERCRAENVRGSNTPPKLRSRKVGRGALLESRSYVVRRSGFPGRENAGMSSEI